MPDEDDRFTAGSLTRHLVAIDPGLMTGVAVWTPETPKPIGFELPIENFYEWVRDTLVSGFEKYDVVCEAFVISQRTVKGTAQPYSLELIGLLKWVCWLRGHTFSLQQASSAKRFADDARLKAIAWYIPGRGHANDALRHMFLHCVKEKIVTIE